MLLSEADNKKKHREPFWKNRFRFQSIKFHNGIFDKFFYISILIYHISISFFSLLSLVFAFKKYLEVVRIQAWIFCAFVSGAIFLSPITNTSRETVLNVVEINFVNSWNHKCHLGRERKNEKCHEQWSIASFMWWRKKVSNSFQC